MQKTAYELRISDWSSDVCSSDLRGVQADEKLPRASDPPASGEKFGGYNPRGRRSGGSDRLEAGVAGTLRGVFAPDSERGGNLVGTSCGIGEKTDNQGCAVARTAFLEGEIGFVEAQDENVVRTGTRVHSSH